jgi:REP element-mobilizing transposase RayT
MLQKSPLEWPFFFTSTIHQWKHVLKEDVYKDVIISSLQFLVNEQASVILNGYVVMNNHVHYIWQPACKYSYTSIQSSFMKYTATKIKEKLLKEQPEFGEQFCVNKYDRKYQIWKREPLKTELFTPAVLQQKLEYIHQNPVRAGLCKYAEEYKYSSAAFYNGGGDPFEIVSDYRG